MDYATYVNKYNLLINKRLVPDWKIYEYLVAIKLGMIVWDDLPPTFGELYNLPHLVDYGIDMIDLKYTKTGQAKYYNGSNITWKTVSTFIAYSLHILKISDMSLITTKNAKVAKIVQHAFPNIIKHEFEELLANIPKVQEIAKPVKLVGIEQRSYTISCTKLFLESKNSLLRFQLPCGIGKSYIVYNIILEDTKTNKDSKYLIIAPWIDLANQMVQELTRFGLNPAMLGGGNVIESDDFSVLVCISASLVKLPDLQYRYIFVDEAHHIEKDDSATFEQISGISREKELHLSATFKKTQNLDYVMDLREAIDNNWLSDYMFNIEYFTQGDMLDNLADLIKSKMEWMPMFIYFNTTERAISFCAKLCQIGVKAEYLIGTCNTIKRAKIISDLNNYELPVLCLCGCFNEGISINNLQTIVFGDFRFSKINRIQIAMRASRKHPNKPYSRLVFPINEDKSNDKHICDILGTFDELDSSFKKSIKTEGNTRLKFAVDNKVGADKAVFLREEVYDRYGRILNGLTTEQKVDEFLAYVEKNGIPKNKCNDKFSDKTKIGLFWMGCKTKNRCILHPYSELLKNTNLASDYAGYKPHVKNVVISMEQKIEIFLLYINKNGIPKYNAEDKFDDGVSIFGFWSHCKHRKKCGKHPYSILLKNEVLSRDYNKCKRQNRPISITLEQKIDELINYVNIHKVPSESCKDKFSDNTLIGSFWKQCRQKRKCDKISYSKLLENKLLFDSYHSLKKISKDVVITTEQKIDEFLEYMQTNEIPPKSGNQKFSDNTKIGAYWAKCRQQKKMR